jgi:hypothetical protein
VNCRNCGAPKESKRSACAYCGSGHRNALNLIVYENPEINHGLRVFTETGEDISGRTPWEMGDRLRRSYDDRRVVKCQFYLINKAGRVFMRGDGPAVEYRRIRVMKWETHDNPNAG